MPSKKKNKNKDTVKVWNGNELVDIAGAEEVEEKPKIKGNARKRLEKQYKAKIRLRRDGKSYAIKNLPSQQSQINEEKEEPKQEEIKDINIQQPVINESASETQIIEESHKEDKKELSNSPAVLELIHSKIPKKLDNTLIFNQEDFAAYQKRQKDAQLKIAEMKRLEAERIKKQTQPKTSQIPGMNNFNNSNQSSVKNDEKPLTEEERLTKQLNFEEMALQNLQSQRGGSPQQISSRQAQILQLQNKIDELKVKLGLTTLEEIDARKKEEQRKEKEQNKVKLRDLEKQLAFNLKLVDDAKGENKLRLESENNYIKKEIERLKRHVPEDERLPIDDDEQKLEDDIVEKNGEVSNGDAKEDAKEEIKEDKLQRPKPHIDNFYPRLNENMNSADVTKHVKSEITNIIEAAGITDKEELFDAVEASYAYIKEQINFIYYSETTAATKMSIDAPLFFQNAFDSLNAVDLKTRNKIIVAQKIADVMLKHYSPVAFANGALDQYADNYVVKDRERLKEELTSLRLENIDTLINEVEAVLAGKIIDDEPEMEKVEQPQIKPEPEKVEQPQFQPKTQSFPHTQYYYSFEDDDGLIDTSKPDAFERRLEEQQRKTQNNIDSKKEEPKQQTQQNFDFDDDFIDGSKPDAFERNLMEQQQKAQNNLDSTQNLTTDENKKIESKLDEQPPKEENVQNNELDLDEMGSINDIQDDPVEETIINNNQVDNKQDKNKVENVVTDNTPKVEFFTKKLAEFGDMYNVNVDVNDYASYLKDAWNLMKDSDAKKQENGKKMVGNLFKSTLKAAFTVEKETAYKEHRLPDFTGVIKSSNDLLRAGMFAFTDLYHNPKSASLFEPTSFGGLTAKEMAELTAGKSTWSMNQKSDEAWEIQSKEAKALAAEWEKEPKPYEKMIQEMNALAANAKRHSINQSDTYKKLVAAEWLLENNKKMMVDDPEDPLNPMPNWGNRYWKAITNAREALGIPKHTSMRELIQGDYAEEARAVLNTKYNETQIQEQLLDADVRQMSDSIEAQKEQFTIESTAVEVKAPQDENVLETEEGLRWRLYIKSEDEREKVKNEPKVFSNMIVSKDNEIKYERENKTIQN